MDKSNYKRITLDGIELLDFDQSQLESLEFKSPVRVTKRVRVLERHHEIIKQEAKRMKITASQLMDIIIPAYFLHVKHCDLQGRESSPCRCRDNESRVRNKTESCKSTVWAPVRHVKARLQRVKEVIPC